jgi:signal transduction histidine kinase
MNTSLKILMVEDNPADADLVLAELRRAGFDPQWQRVETETDYLAGIKTLPAIILSDFALPKFSGMKALELLNASGLNIPFILISGTVGEDIAVEAIKRGANDYFLKDRLTRLAPAVRRALQEVAERAERRRLEAQFIEAQKMEVIGQLASGVAHDFNNILAVIMGNIELIGSELGPTHTLYEFAEEIRHASERAVGLTRQLLVFSRKQAVQPVVLNLNDVMADLEKMLRRLIDENITLTFTPGKNLGRIKADPGYIGQVLMNLVVNARDAMPNGGQITIATENVIVDESARGKHHNAPAGHFAVLTVNDTGTGMTDEVKARLFEAFFTTKPSGKGTGLGLATCQTIVQQSGGHIGLDSELGKGSTFHIYFPQVDLPLAVAPPAVVKTNLPRGTETLLVVEDERSVRHMARRILEAQGYKVLSAVNGHDGLHVVREHNGPPVSLVVTDVVMPLMGGKVMAEWLKTTYPGLKILFTSGYTDNAFGDETKPEPGVEFLAKPYAPAVLIQKVRAMLDGETDSSFLRKQRGQTEPSLPVSTQN